MLAPTRAPCERKGAVRQAHEPERSRPLWLLPRRVLRFDGARGICLTPVTNRYLCEAPCPPDGAGRLIVRFNEYGGRLGRVVTAADCLCVQPRNPIRQVGWRIAEDAHPVAPRALREPATPKWSLLRAS